MNHAKKPEAERTQDYRYRPKAHKTFVKKQLLQKRFGSIHALPGTD